MRFAKLMLERYGRFEGCELDFHERQPDLHVIYGPNEAGKSTSLSAVADLLFGFPTRSPYNFLFDYSLLRVGAVIAEDGRELACRRRKSGGSTLVDGDDCPIAESELLAMLRGQTRDSFRLSFSLDQAALRRGGRAMVDAKDDVGQALFAAGSGLTGVSDELQRIEEEADAIWGRRAKASRAYTQAERELEASMRAIRDESLKPRQWADARQTHEAATQRLDELETQREVLLLESQRAERVRRVAGSVRVRENLLRQIEDSTGTIELAPAVEAAAVSAMEDAETAARARAIAERLLTELEERAGQQAPDPAVLDEANAIEQLVLDSGAVAKAEKDLIRLEGERTSVGEALRRLRSKSGIDEGMTLSAPIVSSLRDLARAHTADVAALEEIATSHDELENRRRQLVESLGAGEQDKNLGALVDAVNAARRLGSDADERCIAARRLADGASARLATALARLNPWTGDAEALRTMPALGSAELERAKEAWAEQQEKIAEDENKSTDLDGEVERLGLQIGVAGTGSAISQQDLAESRHERDALWLPLRAQLLGEQALEDPAGKASLFEEAVAAADGIADRRFTLAEASARLATLEATRAERELEAEQARRRAQAARDGLEGLLNEWQARLHSLHLPQLDPVQLEAWLKHREAALEAEAELTRLEADAARLEDRRALAVASLRGALQEAVPADGGELVDVLARAERARAEAEAREERVGRDRESLSQLEQDIAVMERRRAATTARSEPRRAAWEQLLAGTGVTLDIATAEAKLAAIDEVRQAEESLEALGKRMEGIRRDAELFHSEVVKVAKRLGLETRAGDQEVVMVLRSRLEQARSTKRVLDEVEKDRTKRRSEIEEAGAAHAVAMEAIAPLLAQTGAADAAGLSAAIEGSRALREMRKALADTEEVIVRDGDGVLLEELVEMVLATDPDELAARTDAVARELRELNTLASEAATAQGDASRAFADLEQAPATAADAAFDAEQARAEMAAQAETYILKRAQALTLRWAIERYRERHQDPLLVRASELFSTLTLGRYSALRVELGEAIPRLLGITDDGRAAVEVDAMSEGTTDQLFLALRLAAVEQSVDAGIRLPFLADDLFVNFDDDRAKAGFEVLARLATKTQVLFFTHHSHLAAIARLVVGNAGYSECRLI
jgi:uncharacterized protein YhaN